MDTITKSTKKSLLAATVVALLALVAIAGAVTYSADDSSAESTTYNYVNGSYTPTSDQAAANFFVYGTGSSPSTITIGNFTYTGTITFGYYSSVNGTAYQVPFASVTFTGLKNATVTYDATAKTVTVTTTAADAAVDMTVTAGTVVIGSSVSGTITAAGATVTLDKVTGLHVAVMNGKAYLSGSFTGTVTVAGTAYECGALTIDTDAELIVAEGATVTSCTEVTGQTYDFTYTSAISSTSNYGEMTNAVLYAYQDNDTVMHTAEVTSTATLATASFTDVADDVYTMGVTTGNTSGTSSIVYYDAVVYQGQFYVFPTFTVAEATGTATYAAADSTATATPTYAYYKFTLTTSDSTLAATDVKLLDNSGSDLNKTTDYAVTVNKGVITFYINITQFASATSGTAVTFFAEIDGESFDDSAVVEQIKVTPIFTTASSVKTYADGTFAATKTAAPTDYTAGAAANEVGTVSFKVTAADTKTTNTFFGAKLFGLSNTSLTAEANTNSYTTMTTTKDLSFTDIEPGTYLLSVISGTAATAIVNYNAYVVTIATSNGAATVTVTAVTPSLVASSYTSPNATLTVASAALGTYLDETIVSAYYGTTAATTDGNFTYDSTAKTLNNAAVDVSAAGYLNLIYNGTIVYQTTTPVVNGNGTVTLGSLTLSAGNATSVVFKTAGAGAAAAIVNNGTITVNGTLDLAYDSVQTATGTSGYATLNGTNSVINIAGEMIIDSDATTPYTTGVNAAYYYNTTAATSAPIYTFHYTTLAAANAVADATSITVIGKIAIDADLSITAGTTTAVRTLTIAANAVLSVGTTEKAAVLTVPATTTNTFTTTGTVKVVNGSVKIAGETTDRGSSIVAAVFMQQTVDSVAYGVYTDLATAMAAAVAGDTVALRGDATVISDVVIPAKVTLDLKTFNVTVGAYDSTAKTYTAGSLTVNGTIAGTSSASIVFIYQGSTVTVNTSDASTDKYSYQLGAAAATPLGGTLVIGKDATMAYVMARAYSGAITVDGTVTSAMGAGNIYGAYTLTVNGTMTMYGSAVTDKVAGTAALAYNVVVAKGATLKTDGTFENTNTNFTLTVNGTVTPVAATVFQNDAGAAGTFNIVGTMATTATKTLSIVNLNTVSAKTVAINVTGTLAVAGIADVTPAVIAMTVSGTGAFTSTANVTLNTLTVSDSASFKMIGATTVTATVNTLTVTGTATVLGEAAATAGDSAASVATITASKLVIGEASAKLAENTNGATATVTLTGYGIVYGTAANVTVNPETIASTALYLTDGKANFLYATEYAVSGATSDALVLDTPKIEGYNFNGWFNAAAGGQAIAKGKISDYASIYGIFEPQTFTVTFHYLQGAIYLVNGAKVESGQQNYAYGTELTVSVIAASGYDASKATIQLNTTSPSTSPITYKVTDDANFTAAGVTEKTASKDNGLSLTDILLIILVIITAIVAIAVVLKLARS